MCSAEYLCNEAEKATVALHEKYVFYSVFQIDSHKRPILSLVLIRTVGIYSEVYSH